MNAPAKLAAFGAGLAVLFGGGALAGAAISDEERPVASTQTEEHSSMPSTDVSTPSTHGTDDIAEREPQLVRGLAIAENGLRVEVEDAELRRGRVEQLAFRIVGQDGATVRDFDVEHTKQMHLIVARRDLTGFQHLHPEQRADGSWSVPLRLDEAGSYRLFADFSSGDEAFTLASDLRVDGATDLKPLPAPGPTSVSDGGYDVALEAGDARPGDEANLRFIVSRNGEVVHTEPYLGAGGHLVALREGDLAFLHVHPTEDGHGGEDGGEDDDSVGFAATFPTEGRYRLFLQFKHDGRVQTVAFTQEVR